MKHLMFTLVGVAAGIAFVLSCDGARLSAGADASAAPTDCAAWQIAYLDVTVTGGTNSPTDVPAGWEPFSMTTQGTAFIRRCKP